MEVEHETTVKSAPAAEKPSRTHIDSQPLPTDSMVTVPLSESDAGPVSERDDEIATRDSRLDVDIDISQKRQSSRPTSVEILQAIRERTSQDGSIHTPSVTDFNSPTISLPEEEAPETPKSASRPRSDSTGSDQSAHVDWANLEKDEQREQREEGQDEAMALLLARLEQENNALAFNPKSGLKARVRSESRPPSMNQIKRLVREDASQVRISQLPSPPPMTELEFWAALVRDYPQTVQRLPTLTLNKIRAGVPAPLRGVVWQSMAGARDKLIEDQYETLCGESSPYENIINKDIGRSFPGVEMFRDADGEGQKMLGRVLKCFSLYDHKIGYCQGLGFLVGPLLMQMGDREAFCVLVRLMEDYDLRSCFLPDLSGLHLRIFQFQQLLQQHMPKLAAHLASLQVESAYLSQWFLSFFAVTCPLPMLFRIYDVIFAEGASETIMRVALAIMKRNEEKILGFHEFEDVMQLLLGRALWDPYGRNAKSADQLVNDFVSFTNDVTRESLQGLETKFKEAQKKETGKGGLFPDVQKSAASFLGRLWGPSNSSTKSVTLSPGLTAPSRPVSFLRRTPSKQSLATLDSVGGSDSSSGTQSTALTDITRGSNGDSFSIKSNHESVAGRMGHKDRDLYQIEQLLMSVSQLQRQNSELEAALQKQREDRREDHRIVRTVVDKIRLEQPSLTRSTRESRRRTTITTAPVLAPPTTSSPPPPIAEVAEIVDLLDNRFPAHQNHHRASSMFETKEYLRESLARTKELLTSESLRAQALGREVSDRDAELQSARDALKETRHRLQDSYNQNQRLEKNLQDLRNSSRKPSLPWALDTSPDTPPSLSRSDTAESNISTTSGLRELRLGRSASQKKSSAPQHFAKRSSSLATQAVLSTEDHKLVDNEALLLELVNAKTAEAVAKQELEELKNKFDMLKRAMGVHNSSPMTTPTPTPPSTGGGGFWSGWKRSVSTNNATLPQ